MDNKIIGKNEFIKFLRIYHFVNLFIGVVVVVVIICFFIWLGLAVGDPEFAPILFLISAFTAFILLFMIIFHSALIYFVGSANVVNYAIQMIVLIIGLTSFITALPALVLLFMMIADKEVREYYLNN